MESKNEKSVADKRATSTSKSEIVEKIKETVSTTETTAEVKRTGEILSLSQLLEKQLADIKRKKQLADRRDIFLQKSLELETCLTDLNQEQATGNFTTDNYTLIFAKKSGYRDEDAFKISNPVLMVKFLVALQIEIKQAINGIEEELLKDL